MNERTNEWTSVLGGLRLAWLQRTILWTQFTVSTFTWGLGDELGSPAFQGECLFLILPAQHRCLRDERENANRIKLINFYVETRKVAQDRDGQSEQRKARTKPWRRPREVQRAFSIRRRILEHRERLRLWLVLSQA